MAKTTTIPVKKGGQTLIPVRNPMAKGSLCGVVHLPAARHQETRGKLWTTEHASIRKALMARVAAGSQTGTELLTTAPTAPAAAPKMR